MTGSSSSTATTKGRARPLSFALTALALGAFGIGLAEFVAMGLLADIARDLDVSLPVAGNIVSVYALGVVIGAPLLAAAGICLPPKRLLLMLMAVFILGNAISALAPNFGVLLAGRAVAGLPHGTFLGAGSVLAARLAGPGRDGRAVASLTLGITVSTVVGLPVATLFGQEFGWRATFLVISAIGLAGLVAQAVLVPFEAAGARAGLRAELGAFKSRQVQLTLLVTLVGFGGLFAAYAFLGPIVTDVAGLPESAVSWMFGLCGVGMTLGVLAAGYMTERSARRTVHVSLVGLAAVLILFYFAAQNPWLAAISVTLLGAAGFLMTAPLQTMVIRQAAQAPTLAAAASPAAFNLANAIGVWIAGLTIAAGWGLMSVALSGALLALVGLVISILATRLDDVAGTANGDSETMSPNNVR